MPLGDDVLLVDLGAVSTGDVDGAVWSLPHGGELDANLVRLGAGAAIDEHCNEEVDVLVLVRSGDGEVVVGGKAHQISRGHLVLIPRGSRRAIHAGGHGLIYMSIHRRRGPIPLPTVRRPAL